MNNFTCNVFVAATEFIDLERSSEGIDVESNIDKQESFNWNVDQPMLLCNNAERIMGAPDSK